MRSLILWQSTPEQVATLDEAEAKMLLEARAELGKLPRSRLKPTVQVGLKEALGREFFYKPWDSSSKKLEILSFAQLPNGNLQMTVQAYWTESVVLDSQFKVLSHEKIP